MTGGLDRRQFLIGAAATIPFVASAWRTNDAVGAKWNTSDRRWFMPAEEREHSATWMCWPSTQSLWGEALPDVQNTIATLAVAIAGFEPVKLLVRPIESKRVRDMIGSSVEIIKAPVDDLWARDTLPCFLVAARSGDNTPLVAGRVRFNGWGKKQVHHGDTQLAGLVAAHLDIPVRDSGLVGEGGGLEVDGEGTVLAARSSWVNDNRNPGRSEAEIGAALVDMLGAKRLIWVDGVAGKDITDGHIDALARFASPGVIVLDEPSYTEPGETFYDLFVDTRKALSRVHAGPSGTPTLAYLREPEHPRGSGNDFLSSYVNYYVCNGAVIAPSFGDKPADNAAADQLRELYPEREIVQLDIDPIAAGGGGIHCATQQQPRV